MDHRQKGWLTSAEFVVNSKVYLVTKVSPFIANYGRELKMGVVDFEERISVEVRRQEKLEVAEE